MVSEQKILNLVRLHQPIKAREIAQILTKEFNQHTDRSDVNSILYRMKKENKVVINKNYEWSLAEKMLDSVQESSISTPVSKAEITFTPEQESIINLDPTEHLLIRGQAGSGKTTVLAARAGKILSAMNKGSLLFLTYNSSLCAYVKKTFKKAGMAGDIDVHTFHDWAKSCAQSMGANFSDWVDSKERSEELAKIISISKQEIGEHRLYEIQTSSELLKWWGEEIAWLFGQHITRLNEYLIVERTNRGTAIRLSQEDRRFVWHVYELYMEWLEENNKQDYDNPAGLILNTLEQQGIEFPDNLRYDHVMVDEVQDFDKSWLLAVVKLPRVSLSLAGDLAQKIYRRNFTWKSVGIRVQGGRSHNLLGSHRTTFEIMQVAQYLLKNHIASTEEVFTPPIYPNRHGNKVRKILGSSAKDAYEKGYDFIAENFKRLRTTTVAVALPFSNQVYPVQQALKKRGIETVKAARGKSLGNFDGGIVVTTYHQLKGLEFDHVVILGLHDSQYPARLLTQIPEEDQLNELEMMQRILYVVMTRAKASVTLVGSNPFCRFFNDISNELFESIEN
ncbi:UvrD-helicase domain-containing protein [Neisseria sp. P0019.S002]|jgi:DNA helicase|uniref:UvrD-helicase domain-containing protein n=1 Tax=Neisseria sp. P0019.S002 TaxID=3436798 RepID=UPI003F7FCC0B